MVARLETSVREAMNGWKVLRKCLTETPHAPVGHPKQGQVSHLPSVPGQCRG